MFLLTLKVRAESINLVIYCHSQKTFMKSSDYYIPCPTLMVSTTFLNFSLFLVIRVSNCFSGRAVLERNEYLCPGHHLMSENKKYKIFMQFDGNLVLYRYPGHKPIWAINRRNYQPSIKGLHFASNGNLVLYTNNGILKWSKSLEGKQPRYIKLDKYGRVRVYSENGLLVDYLN